MYESWHATVYISIHQSNTNTFEYLHFIKRIIIIMTQNNNLED